jgi:excisionase family DNA binding protein
METAAMLLRHLIPALEEFRRELEQTIKQRETQAGGGATPGAASRSDEDAGDAHGSPTLDVTGASTMLGIAKSTVYLYVSRRAIPHYKIGTRLLFNERKLRSWMRAREVRPVSTPQQARRGSRTQVCE